MLGRLWDRLRGRRHGDWMWCSTGSHFYPLDPLPQDVDYLDVARGLATECRYAGHVRQDAPYPFYSVAEHSVMVSQFAAALAHERGFSVLDVLEAERWGLHHDDTEAFIGDMIRPLKYQREMRQFRRAEARIEVAVRAAFSLRPSREVEVLVDEVDSRILTDEIAQVIRRPDMDRVRRKFGPALGAVVRFLPPREAEQEWLYRHEALEFTRAMLLTEAA